MGKAIDAVEYRALAAAQIGPALFSGFSRRQEVTRCWRKVDGIWCVRDIAFIDDWTRKEYGAVIAELREIAEEGGLVLGAFSGGKLVGFASVAPRLFGRNAEYLDLSLFIVSAEARRLGVGRTMFQKTAAWARVHGAKKLYLSAHSSVESQAFYRAMGCVEAAEYSQSHVEKEPCDCQMEYVL